LSSDSAADVFCKKEWLDAAAEILLAYDWREGKDVEFLCPIGIRKEHVSVMTDGSFLAGVIGLKITME
jgi:hypothetical protein